jgi:hypothetical protein
VTVNLGARYELSGPWNWAGNRLVNFKAGVQSKVFPTAPLGMLFNGDEGIPQTDRKLNPHTIAPRIGIAIDVFGNGKTAIRGGYGIYYLARQADRYQAGQPYMLSMTVPLTPSLVNPWGTFAGGNPFPVDITKPRFVSPVALTFYSLTNAVTPYVQQLNLTVQQELRRDFSVQVSYVGNLARKGMTSRDLNYPVFVPGTSTSSNYNSRRPYLPGVIGSITEYSTAANAEYNGLKMTVNRRFRKGLSVMGNYTFSKTMDIGSSDTIGLPYPYNANLTRGRADGQPQHIASASFLWQLPRINRWSFVGSQILGGWQVNGMWSLMSGTAFGVSSGVDTNYDGSSERADLVGNPFLPTGRPRAQLIAQYFNTSAFAVPPLGTFSLGSSGRNLLTGPGGSNTNLSFFKIFRLKERHQVQFRAEFFNLFNQVWFGNPTAALNSGNNGKILTAGAPRIVQFGLRYSF